MAVAAWQMMGPTGGSFKPQMVINADKYLFNTEHAHSAGANKWFFRKNDVIDAKFQGSGLGQLFNGAYMAEYQG